MVPDPLTHPSTTARRADKAASGGPPTRERRPAANETAKSSTAIKAFPSVAAATDNIRCTRCGAPLSAARSVRLELGPVCRRLAAGEVAA